MRRCRRPSRRGVPGHPTSARPHAAARPSVRWSRISGRPPRRPDPDHAADPEVVPRTPSLGELLEEISEARAHTRAPYEVDETPWAGPPRRGVGFPACRMSDQDSRSRISAVPRLRCFCLSAVRRPHRRLVPVSAKSPEESHDATWLLRAPHARSGVVPGNARRINRTSPRQLGELERVALERSGAAAGVWLLELATGIPTRFTFNGSESGPIWSSNGRELVFTDFRSGTLHRKVIGNTEDEGAADVRRKAASARNGRMMARRFSSSTKMAARSTACLCPGHGGRSCCWRPRFERISSGFHRTVGGLRSTRWNPGAGKCT